MRRFWNWIHTDSGERVLRLDGPIAHESWFGDETTPAQFEADLYDGRGDITIFINSPGVLQIKVKPFFEKS